MTRLRLAAVLLSLASAVASRAAHAGSYLVYRDDSAGFAAALIRSADSTVVDSGGAFQADAATGTSIASVTRTGFVAGQAFTFVVSDVNFAGVPTGSLAVGQDIVSTSTLAVEAPVANGGATGTGTFGYDSQGATDGTTTRNALVVDFTTTPGGLGVGHFALDLVDFEAGGTPGELRLYDGGLLVFADTFTFPGPGLGNGETHFLGVVAAGPDAFFDQAVLVIGDEAAGAGTENWAADRFRFGVAHNPEPATWALFGLGAAGLAALARRRRARAAGTRPPAAAR